MSERTYNGWTNYETWRVNLELCDEYCESQAEDVRGGYQDRYPDIETLARVLEEYVDEVLTSGGMVPENSIALSYARSFVNDVDWYEIAEHWKDDLVESEDNDEDEGD